jgi:hypothetical protein
VNKSLVTFEEPGEYLALQEGLQEQGMCTRIHSRRSVLMNLIFFQRPLDRFWYWTNGFRPSNESEWTWVTANSSDCEVPITEFYWAPWHPSEDNSSDTCINFNVGRGGWEDDHCDGVCYLNCLCEVNFDFDY